MVTLMAIFNEKSFCDVSPQTTKRGREFALQDRRREFFLRSRIPTMRETLQTYDEDHDFRASRSEEIKRVTVVEEFVNIVTKLKEEKSGFVQLQILYSAMHSKSMMEITWQFLSSILYAGSSFTASSVVGLFTTNFPAYVQFLGFGAIPWGAIVAFLAQAAYFILGAFSILITVPLAIEFLPSLWNDTKETFFMGAFFILAIHDTLDEKKQNVMREWTSFNLPDNVDPFKFFQEAFTQSKFKGNGIYDLPISVSEYGLYNPISVFSGQLPLSIFYRYEKELTSRVMEKRVFVIDDGNFLEQSGHEETGVKESEMDAAIVTERAERTATKRSGNEKQGNGSERRPQPPKSVRDATLRNKFAVPGRSVEQAGRSPTRQKKKAALDMGNGARTKENGKGSSPQKNAASASPEPKESDESEVVHAHPHKSDDSIDTSQSDKIVIRSHCEQLIILYEEVYQQPSFLYEFTKRESRETTIYGKLVQYCASGRIKKEHLKKLSNNMPKFWDSLIVSGIQHHERNSDAILQAVQAFLKDLMKPWDGHRTFTPPKSLRMHVDSSLFIEKMDNLTFLYQEKGLHVTRFMVFHETSLPFGAKRWKLVGQSLANDDRQKSTTNANPLFDTPFAA